jgi:hypothetical protein
MALDPDERARRTLEQSGVPAHVPVCRFRSTSHFHQGSPSRRRNRGRAVSSFKNDAVPFGNSGAAAPVNSVLASHAPRSIRHFPDRPNTGRRSRKLVRDEFFGCAAGTNRSAANLEKCAVNFTTHYFSSYVNRPSFSRFYSTIECRVEGLLLDTPRRVEFAVTLSKQSTTVHSTRHLFEGYPKRCFCAFSTSRQAFTPAEKS